MLSTQSLITRFNVYVKHDTCDQCATAHIHTIGCKVHIRLIGSIGPSPEVSELRLSLLEDANTVIAGVGTLYEDLHQIAEEIMSLHDAIYKIVYDLGDVGLDYEVCRL